MFLGEVKALAGCDLLTISPKLLEELDSSNEVVYESLTEKSGMFIVSCHVLESGFENKNAQNMISCKRFKFICSRVF
jgi:transaldolase